MADWKQIVGQQLADLRLAPARENAIVEEIAQHLEDRYQDLLLGGATPGEAERRLRAELSEGALLQRELRRVERQIPQDPIVMGNNRRGNMIANFWQDLRYGARMLLKRPGVTLTAVLTLGLGIGANTAIFSVVDTVVLRPLPYREPRQLVRVWGIQSKRDRSVFSPGEFLDYQSQSRSFTEMAAYNPMSLTLTGGGEPEALNGLIVSANYFSTLGAQVARGRAFQAEDGRVGAQRVAVLSHSFWRRRFGANPNAIGNVMTINGESCVVVGVMPPGFQEDAFQVWLNPRQVVPDWIFNSHDDLLSMRHTGYLNAIARLKPNVTVPQAQSDLDGVAARLQQQNAGAAGRGASVQSLQEQEVGNVRPTLLLLLGAVLLILLIACANVAGLLLAQATGRHKEIAVRAALGASRPRIARQLLIESVLLAALGGAGGWLLSIWVVRLIVRSSLAEIPRLSQVGLDYRVLLFTLGVTLATGVAFGLAPALSASTPDLNSALKQGSRNATTGSGRNRLRQGLVVAEVALALVVLIGAGLLLNSFARLIAVKPGFDPRNLYTMKVSLSDGRYSKNSEKKRFVRELNERLDATPGVTGVAICDDLPIAGTNSTTSVKEKDRVFAAGAAALPVGLHVINPRYFDGLGTRLVKGRVFDARDAAGAPSVFIVNESMARRLWPGEEPLGKHIRYNSSDPWGTVVGVVEDVKYDGLNLESGLHLFEPYQQNAWPGLTVAVRSPMEPSALLAAVQRAVHSIDPNMPISKLGTMDEVMAQSLATRRLALILFGSFACLALLLAAVGVYGVLAASVSQRTQEMGVRIAVGAKARDIFQLIVGQGMKLVMTGILIGLAGAFALNRVIKTLLFGVSATDPLTYAAIALLLTAVALLACWIPARRATKVDPLTALRWE
jgi:putative ABC transport system permease protein